MSFDPLHEFIRNVSCGIGGTHAQVILAGIVLPVYKVRKVVMPIFHIKT